MNGNVCRRVCPRSCSRFVARLTRQLFLPKTQFQTIYTIPQFLTQSNKYHLVYSIIFVREHSVQVYYLLFMNFDEFNCKRSSD